MVKGLRARNYQDIHDACMYTHVHVHPVCVYVRTWTNLVVCFRRALEQVVCLSGGERRRGEGRREREGRGREEEGRERERESLSFWHM